jgi:hypothetical protein
VADTYDVTPADVAAELPGLYLGGFTSTSTPTADQVVTMISTQDTIVSLRITDDVGRSPALSDRAAAVAKRYIIESVKAMVVRIAYMGNDPVQVNAAAQPYSDIAKATLQAIDLLGQQAVGTGESAPTIVGNMATRALVLGNDDLDASCGSRGRF